MTTDAIIVAEGVEKALASGDVTTPVLRGVTLTIARGSFTAIVGPSGCGKTTFLSMLGALDRPDRGTLLVDGTDLVTARGAALDGYRRTIGLVLQFWNLMPTLTALENVETGLELSPLSPAARRERAAEYLDRVGLAAARDKFPAQLSGGMQQRVAVARALARQPRLLLADEPTGSLDRESGLLVFELIERLVREQAITCVMVTHDPELAARTGNVITLVDGRVATASPGSRA
ncbi:MAG: Phosphonate-transporting ATPase [Labilithrix sp.]|nr:Phosphonate-transporting ATPase [Labilithrix sp.]